MIILQAACKGAHLTFSGITLKPESGKKLQQNYSPELGTVRVRSTFPIFLNLYFPQEKC